MQNQAGKSDGDHAKHVDVLCVGEALVDLISEAEQRSLQDSRTFHLYPGGQVSNLALNVARLGGTSALVARVGDDAFGLFLRQHLVDSGVQTEYVRVTSHTPTTLVAVTRHMQTPDFSAYRGADTQLVPEDLPQALLSQTSLVHTSAFALSHEPSRSTIIQFVTEAHQAGCLISFDPNYHVRLWEKDEDPLTVLAKICPYVFLVKPSLDDCARLFGPNQKPETYASRFLDLGARNVVVTMGQMGAMLVNAEGIFYHAAIPVDVVDVTGAGDSFWSGLLLGVLDGYPVADAVRVALSVAAIKLQRIGPLTIAIDRGTIYKELGLAP